MDRYYGLPVGGADVAWAPACITGLHRKPFDAELLLQQFAPSFSGDRDKLAHAPRIAATIADRDPKQPEVLAGDTPHDPDPRDTEPPESDEATAVLSGELVPLRDRLAQPAPIAGQWQEFQRAHWPSYCRASTNRAKAASRSTVSISATCPPMNSEATSASCRKTPFFSPAPSTTTSSSPTRMQASKTSSRHAEWPRYTTSSNNCRRVTRPQSANTGRDYPGGQKQRIAVARALLSRPNILNFDEATSNRDEKTANAFGETINALRGKVTIVLIAHRLPVALKGIESINPADKHAADHG